MNAGVFDQVAVWNRSGPGAVLSYVQRLAPLAWMFESLRQGQERFLYGAGALARAGDPGAPDLHLGQQRLRLGLCELVFLEIPEAPTRSKELAGDLQHTHNALDDAMASAELLLKMKEGGLAIRLGGKANAEAFTVRRGE